MPLFVAFVKAELEGVASLAPPEDVTWKIDVKHSSGDEVRSGVTICASDEVRGVSYAVERGYARRTGGLPSAVSRRASIVDAHAAPRTRR